MSIVESMIQSFVHRQFAQASAAPPAPQAKDRSLAKALIAGAIGGAVGTAAKTFAEKIYPPRTHGEPQPTEILAEKAAGHALAETNKFIASETIHWTFGIAVGAAYGALAEYYPAASSRGGVNFGMTLMALTHESTLPAMGLGASPEAQNPREKTSEIATHVIYGVVAETTRRLVRKTL